MLGTKAMMKSYPYGYWPGSWFTVAVLGRGCGSLVLVIQPSTS